MTTTSIDEGKLEAFMGQAVTDMAHQRCLRGNETLSPAAWSTQLVASLGRTGISFAWSVDVTNGATGQIGDYYRRSFDGRWPYID